MKKILLILVCAVFSVKGFAGDGDHYFTLNAGFLFPNTLNATLGYERELEYGNAVELFGEIGNRWRKILYAERYARTCFGKAIIGMAACCINSDWFVTKTACFAFAWAHSSVPTKENTFSASKEVLNITISFQAVYSSP
jgi:hypothetical protein